jgi:hypothetical protein
VLRMCDAATARLTIRCRVPPAARRRRSGDRRATVEEVGHPVRANRGLARSISACNLDYNRLMNLTCVGDLAQLPPHFRGVAGGRR